jgi:hypothetical protein
MANAIYPLYRGALLDGSSNVDLAAGTVKAALVDTGTYTYSAAHQFLSDLSGVVGTAVTLGTKTTTTGTFDSANPTWTSVSGATAEAIVLYIDTGVAGTSRLVLYLDTGQTGLPVTPNGGDITYTVDAAGWFTLGG